MDVEDDGEAEEEEEEETTQTGGGEHELNQSTDNQDNVCGGSAELAEETGELETNLDS